MQRICAHLHHRTERKKIDISKPRGIKKRLVSGEPRFPETQTKNQERALKGIVETMNNHVVMCRYPDGLEQDCRKQPYILEHPRKRAELAL